MQQGFEGYLPLCLAARSHARRRDWVEKPVFPGYLFVRLDLAADHWRAVRSTVGVRALVGTEHRPTAVPPRVIQDIRESEDERGFVLPNRRRTYDQGKPVRLVEGALLDVEAVFACRSGKGRALILLELLGRQVQAKVPMRSLAPEL